MKREDLRKVEVKRKNDEIVKGYFHQWIVSTQENKSALGAIVELEDGNIIVQGAKNVRFIRPDKIDEII